MKYNTEASYQIIRLFITHRSRNSPITRRYRTYAARKMFLINGRINQSINQSTLRSCTADKIHGCIAHHATHNTV